MPGLEDNERVISDALQLTGEWRARGLNIEASLAMGSLEAMVVADEREGRPPSLLMAADTLDQISAILAKSVKILNQ